MVHEKIQPFITPVIYNKEEMSKIVETICKIRQCTLSDAYKQLTNSKR